MDAEPRLASVRVRDPRATPALGAGRTWVFAGDRLALAQSVSVFVLTRLTVFLVAACVIRLGPAPVQPPAELYLGRSALAAWIRWDAGILLVAFVTAHFVG
jgi:hypothetical protein